MGVTNTMGAAELLRKPWRVLLDPTYSAEIVKMAAQLLTNADVNGHHSDVGPRCSPLPPP